MAVTRRLGFPSYSFVVRPRRLDRGILTCEAEVETTCQPLTEEALKTKEERMRNYACRAELGIPLFPKLRPI